MHLRVDNTNNNSTVYTNKLINGFTNSSDSNVYSFKTNISYNRNHKSNTKEVR